jgi:hypothetical protein
MRMVQQMRIVLERTIDRQQGQSNPNTTKHIKLTTMY